MSEIFNKDFFEIEDDEIKLELIKTFDEKEGALPFYWWNIIPKEVGIPVGKISFRIGNNYHSYFNGNIGYEVDEEYRGHNYSYKACKLILNIGRYYNMKFINIACNFDNIASYKTIEKLGAKLIEEVVPPRDYIFYYDGISKQKIYLLNLL